VSGNVAVRCRTFNVYCVERKGRKATASRNTQYICCLAFNVETLHRYREREWESEDRGAVTGTTLNTITWEERGKWGVRGVCYSDGSQAVPARPSGKGRLETKLTRWEVKKVAWREVDCWESGTGGRGWAFGLSLEIWGRHYSEILITLGGLCAGGNFEVNCGKGCNRSAHCNFKIRI